MVKKSNHGDFDHSMAVGAKMAGLSISITVDLLDFCTHPFLRLIQNETNNSSVSSGSAGGNSLLMKEAKGK